MRKKKEPIDNTPDAEILQTLAGKDEETKPEMVSGERSDVSSDEPTSVSPEISPRTGKPKRKYTRRAGVQQQQQDITSFIHPDIVKAIVGFPYEILAKRFGEHWSLSDKELETMVPVHLQLAQEYLPDYIKQHPALYSCIFLHALALVARAQVEIKLRQAANVGSETILREEGKREVVPNASRPSGIPPLSDIRHT